MLEKYINKSKIKNQTLFNSELKQVKNMDRGVEYYEYIINNIKLDPKNTTNSHVMYAAEKVKNLDESKPVNIKEGNQSLPDIDIDLPPNFRSVLIKYIEEKYGKDCVAHIITHSRFKGKGAIKEVFKITKPVSNYFDVANEITKAMVDEAKISDELAEIQIDDPHYGIIQWNIDHVKVVKQYYETFKKEFEMAIDMEKIPKNEGVHAAGLIIADQPLMNLFPLRYNKKIKQLVVDIEGSDIEYLGGVKFDILGVAALEKVYQIQQMINYKKNEIPFGIDRNFEDLLYGQLQ